MPTDRKLDTKDRQNLASAFGCTEAELDSWLLKVDKAATKEYTDMMLGIANFSRGTDMREYRLLLLIENAFVAIPSDEAVCRLFQISSSGARSLLRAVISKYRYRLDFVLQSGLKDVLSNASLEVKGAPRYLTIESAYLVEEINRKLSAARKQLPGLRPHPSALSMYEMEAVAYEYLSAEIGVGTKYAPRK